ncbi:DNA-binding transcriptional regulator, FrmR family [Dethiosulfatibacter aminovorans DSM 17477]|uniref:DNA-binding transcriptional regulator, FrmR family n=1 Tax=Dethiosulfatibacter aminovorans DSM 17477 TaxID=1121476 RepID=A0A1M6D509_9FIRM|nr:metal-sensitive transcriptional regulator [Dethiosulfatibacter aminovorans]SHI68352.1 DNA-binding transcriptional regulator, FrmR family [Dethiosulfatibacter aminovorans DSM 17477]
MDSNKQLLNRMKRIEGQVKGIQRMIENGEFCGDVLIQISAAKSALNKVGGMVMENYAKNCFKERAEAEDPEKALEELLNIIIKYSK